MYVQQAIRSMCACSFSGSKWKLCHENCQIPHRTTTVTELTCKDKCVSKQTFHKQSAVCTQTVKYTQSGRVTTQQTLHHPINLTQQHFEQNNFTFAYYEAFTLYSDIHFVKLLIF